MMAASQEALREDLRLHHDHNHNFPHVLGLQPLKIMYGGGGATIIVSTTLESKLAHRPAKVHLHAWLAPENECLAKKAWRQASQAL